MMYLGIHKRETNGLKHVSDLLCRIWDMDPGDQPALDKLSTYLGGNEILIGVPGKYIPGPPEGDPWHFSSYPLGRGGGKLRIRTRGDEYFVDEQGLFRTGRQFGNLMHLVFSRIRNPDDVHPILNSLVKEGVLPGAEFHELQEQISGLLDQPLVREWFSGDDSQLVLNERGITCEDGQVIRPDRVILKGSEATVIDFKFGVQEKDAYHTQVEGYMDRLREMGYQKIQGFLWYVSLNKIIPVK
jgi:hypothetical protein